MLGYLLRLILIYDILRFKNLYVFEEIKMIKYVFFKNIHIRQPNGKGDTNFYKIENV